MSSRLTQLLLVLFAAAAAAAILAAVSLGGADRRETPASPAVGAADVERLYAGILQSGTSLGNPDAPVTLVEYADLQCPFCGEYSRGALPEIVERYVRTGKVRLELRVLRFLGPDSARAAEVAAAAAAQNRLFQFADVFYRNQGEENSGYATDDFLRQVAEAAGLDAERAMSERSGEDAEHLLAGFEMGAHHAGIQSTPSFAAGRTGGKADLIGVGAPSAADLSAKLDRLLR